MKYLTNILFGMAVAGAMTAVAADYTPPCTISIDSQEAFDQWTPIDVNGDGGSNQWLYSADKGGAYYVENKNQAANDWLISPAVTLREGATYKVTLFIQNCTTYSSDKQKVSINVGNSAEIDAQTQTIAKNESLAKSSWPVELCGEYTSTESGDAYFGIHLYSASWMGDCLITKLVIEELLTHPGAVTDLQITAAPLGELKADLTWNWPSVNDKGGDLDAITGARIYRGQNSNVSATDTYLIATYDTDATPGSAASWTDNTLTSAGEYYYIVVPFNANGASTSTVSKVQSPWIGKDTPGAVSDVTATVDPENDKNVFLNFTLPQAAHGGYLDISEVAYKITRAEGTSSAETIEDAWTGELPYTDTTIPGLGSYVYQVYTVYDGSTSWSGVKSNAVIAGGAAPLPYSNTFDNTNSISLWTMLNEGTGSRDWGISSSALNYWGASSNVDVYAVTPPFEFESGHPYKITFDARVTNASSPKPLSVLIGKEATAAALTETLFDETITSALASQKTITFSVAESGINHIAFRVHGNITGTNDIYVDNLKIEEIPVAPLPVSDLTATAGDEGEMKVNVAWTNPLNSNDGEVMTNITKVEISRGNDIIATLENLVPGEPGTYTDTTVETPGVYTYSVTAYLNENAGESVSAATGWVGHDTPKAPADVTVSLNENGSRTISFSPVTESVHGGYVDYATLTYHIMRDGEKIGSTKKSPYVDSTSDLPLASYIYGVKAVSDDMESEITSAAGIVFGSALKLPYTPDFSNADFSSLWTFTNPSNPAKNWKYDTNNKGLLSEYNGSWAITPPFKAIAGTIEVSYKARCYNWRYPDDLEVYFISDIDNLEGATKIADYHTESTIPSVEKTEITIEATGTYYIGYKLVSADSWGCTLQQSDIVQTAYETGINDVTSDGIGFDGATGRLILPGAGLVEIYTLSGMKVISENAIDSLSLRSLGTGTYIVIFTSADGNQSTLKLNK